MKKVSKYCALGALALLAGCAAGQQTKEPKLLEGLEAELTAFTDSLPGQFGVAVITDGGDTLTVNNRADYPLMSMFKLHESIAVCRVLDGRGVGLDSLVRIERRLLDADTWSPMLREHEEDVMDISVKELLDYILVHSDNNASNVLFDRIVSVSSTDSITRSFVSDGSFKLVYTEAQMKAEHSLAYGNVSSPLAYAEMVNKVFADSIVSASKQAFIKDAMRRCDTGMERIAAGLGADASFSHRTGSGYINSRGEVVAVNDGGYVLLPGGVAYTVVVMVKDFKGPQPEAEKYMAEISRRIYCRLASAASTVARSSSSCLSRLMMVPSGPKRMMHGMPVIP